MKKTILILALCLPVALISSFTTTATAVCSESDWMKSKTGTWPGMKDGKWYKFDNNWSLWVK